MKRNIVVLLGGIVVITLVVFVFQKFETKRVSTQPADEHTDTSVSQMRVSKNAIYVAEQRPGNTILVNAVALEAPGYVVIHESLDGKPGNILGQSQLISGTTAENITIPLTRSIIDGEELIAMLHTEKEGTGFDASLDTPVLDAQKTPYYMIFEISADAPDPKESNVVF